MTFMYAYGTALIAYLIVEGLWLGIIAKQSYKQALSGKLRDSYKVWPWLVFYAGYTAANVHFTVMPNASATSVLPTLLNAAIFGAAGYGAYNLTCYSTLKDWPLGITLKRLGLGHIRNNVKRGCCMVCRGCVNVHEYEGEHI